MSEQLNADIRYLGMLLGNVIAEQEGEEVFNRVELARQVAFQVAKGQRDMNDLVQLCEGIEAREFLPIARAFNHFALLANLVEDLYDNDIYLADREAGIPAPNSSLQATWRKLEGAKVAAGDVEKLLANAQVAPVLTAHPTET